MSYLHGIERVELADGVLAGKRVGLITNQTGLTVELKRSMKVCAERGSPVTVFDRCDPLGSDKVKGSLR